MSVVRVVYFGTPEYAVPALRALCSDARFDVVLVVTQPDRKAGRGHKLVAPAVKTAALELGRTVYQPEALRTQDLRQPLVDANADLFVVAAYGLIFGEKTLSIPRYGAVNLHASLLPAYRGSNPIAASIASGDTATGVSLMKVERGLDSGPVIASKSIAISPDDTTATLTASLADLGANLLIERIGGYLDGSLEPVPQPATGVTFARPMKKADGEIDWNQPARLVDCHIRAMWPWPRAWALLGETPIQIHSARPDDGDSGEKPGTIRIDREVFVDCLEGSIVLETVQIPGKPPMDASAAARGGAFQNGSTLISATSDRDPLVTTVSVDSATSV